MSMVKGRVADGYAKLLRWDVESQRQPERTLGVSDSKPPEMEPAVESQGRGMDR